MIKIIKAVINALNEHGFGSGASRLLSGTYSPHKKLEKRIAEFKKTQAALVFNTGYAANTGIIPALAGTDSIIFSDELNHASIIDGIRLSRAAVKIYKHKDLNHLESILKKGLKGKTKKIKQRLIMSDSVFSMDGDIAPLKDLVSLSDKYEAVLMIDDAHGTGVLGQTGRGALEYFGIKAGNIIQVGTFSKAFGCFGAFVAGKRDLIDLQINKARSFMYSTALPPAVAEASIRAIDIIELKSHNLKKRLWKNRQRLYKGLVNLGFDTLGSETPIIPVLAGDVNEALKIGKYLYRKKIFAPAIRPPTVPEGKCRIRFSVTAAHTDDDIDMVLKCLKTFK
jgi:8-amino-7-oxononanoate synthase